MIKIKWEPDEVVYIKEVKEAIELQQDNVKKVLEELMSRQLKGIGQLPEAYNINRILIGLVLIDLRQYHFYKVTLNARTTLGIKDSKSDWSIKLHQTSSIRSLKEDLMDIFNLPEETADEIIGRAV